jgi:hypothetical protein
MTILRRAAYLACLVISSLSGGQVLAQENFSTPQTSGDNVQLKKYLNSLVRGKNPDAEPVRSLAAVSENAPSTDATDLGVLGVQPEWRIAEETVLEEAIAQSPEAEEEVAPRRAADRYNRRLSNHYSYFAVGGNIGITGDASGLGKGGGGTLGKTGYSENISLHTGGIILGDSASVGALTYDFPVRADTGAVLLSPFVGAGAIWADLFNEDFSFGPLFMAGVDVPISYSFILTGRVNVGYLRENTEVGIMLGVGYIFTRSIWDLF